MSVAVTDESHVALFCDTTGRAFGPVFESVEHAEDFLGWLDGDARDYHPDQLALAFGSWRRQRTDLETGALR